MSDIKLSEAQARLLVESYRQGFVTSLTPQTNRTPTASKLVDLGLAEPAKGFLYAGGPVVPISVWGGPLTALGRLMAEALIAQEGQAR